MPFYQEPKVSLQTQRRFIVTLGEKKKKHKDEKMCEAGPDVVVLLQKAKPQIMYSKTEYHVYLCVVKNVEFYIIKIAAGKCAAAN